MAGTLPRPPEVVEILLDPEELAAGVRALGARIAADYRGRSLHLIGVLRGAVPFLADLARAIPLEDVTFDFLGISSYGRDTDTSGVVRFTKDLDDPVVDRDVLIVEDIVDTGLTLAYLREQLARRRPRSLAVVVLLDKPARRRVEVPVEYVGFTIADRFVVGYGLDRGARSHHVPYVGAVDG